jgi:hypothetical protein
VVWRMMSDEEDDDHDLPVPSRRADSSRENERNIHARLTRAAYI